MTAEVRPGQVWADNDQRSDGRTVRVERVDSRYAYCVDSRGRHTRILIERLRPWGFRLVSDTSDTTEPAERLRGEGV